MTDWSLEAALHEYRIFLPPEDDWVKEKPGKSKKEKERIADIKVRCVDPDLSQFRWRLLTNELLGTHALLAHSSLTAFPSTRSHTTLTTRPLGSLADEQRQTSAWPFAPPREICHRTTDGRKTRESLFCAKMAARV